MEKAGVNTGQYSFWDKPQVIIIWVQAINTRFLTFSNEQKYEIKKDQINLGSKMK